MLVPLDTLKPGDKFCTPTGIIIYKVESEPVAGKILCSDEFGFGEMFDTHKIVRLYKDWKSVDLGF